MELATRSARAEETAAVSAVLVEAAEWLIVRGDALWTLEALTAERVAPHIEAGEYVLGLFGDRIVATMRLQLEDPLFWPEAGQGEALYLHRLAVRREVAGRGFSQAMLGVAVQEARAQRCRWLRLDCDAARPSLRKLYEAFGFVRVEERVVRGLLVTKYQYAVDGD